MDEVQQNSLFDVKDQRFRTMADNFQDVFWMYNADFSELLYVNDQVKDLYGISPRKLKENPLSFLNQIHPDDRPKVKQKMQQLTEGNKVKFENRVDPSSDYNRWVDVQGVPITDGNQTVEKIIGASREITAQKKAQQWLETEKDRFKSIVYLQESVAQSNLNLDQVMDTVVEEILEITRADGAVIALAEDDKLTYRAASGTLTDQIDLRLNVSETLAGKCYREGSLKRSPEVASDERVNKERLEEMGLDCGTMLIIPLQYSEECFGVLKITASEPNQFDSMEENVLNLLSGMVSASIYQSLQYLQKEKYLEQVQTMALTDPLTGLPNRRALLSEIDEAVNRSKRDSRKVSLGILDLDYFKDVNDTYGHQVGDQVLEKIARILRNETRHVDTAGRYGGEEFGLLLPDTGLDKAESILRRLLETLRNKEFEADGETFGITASVGITNFNEGDSREDLIQRADSALYDAKSNGRDRIVKK
ncbi:MAG: diguanylate cyclase [bacterium]